MAAVSTSTPSAYLTGTKLSSNAPSGAAPTMDNPWTV